MASSTGIFNTTGQVVVPGPGPACYGFEFFGDGVNASTVTIYSGTGAVSGNELFRASFAAATANVTQILIFKNPVASTPLGNFGLWAVVTGTGGGGILYWEGGA